MVHYGNGKRQNLGVSDDFTHKKIKIQSNAKLHSVRNKFYITYTNKI